MVILSWLLEVSAFRIAWHKLYMSQSYVKLRSVNFARLIFLWVLRRPTCCCAGSYSPNDLMESVPSHGGMLVDGERVKRKAFQLLS